MVNVLVVDDEEALDIAENLRVNDEFNVQTARGAAAAMDELRCREYDVVLLDIVMRHADRQGHSPDPALRTLDDIKRLHPETEVIVLTSLGTEEEAVMVMEKGAFSYVDKSLHGWSILPIKIRLAHRQKLGGLHGVYLERLMSRVEQELATHLDRVVTLVSRLTAAELLTPEETRAYVDPILEEANRSIAETRELIMTTAQCIKAKSV